MKYYGRTVGIAILLLVMKSATAAGASGDMGTDEACLILKKAVSAIDHLPVTGPPGLGWFCEFSANEDPAIYVVALRSNRPEPYSNLMGWYAVRRKDGSVWNWDMGAYEPDWSKPLTKKAATTEPNTLLIAVQQHLKLASTSDVPYHKYALVDLNGDGILDAIVLLADSDYCGSGGCNLEIFRGSPDGFRFVSSSTLSREPIQFSAQASLGWKTLIVASQGSPSIVLRYDGSRYPANPSLQPSASHAEIKAAMTLTLTSSQ